MRVFFTVYVGVEVGVYFEYEKESLDAAGRVPPALGSTTGERVWGVYQTVGPTSPFRFVRGRHDPSCPPRRSGTIADGRSAVHWSETFLPGPGGWKNNTEFFTIGFRSKNIRRGLKSKVGRCRAHQRTESETRRRDPPPSPTRPRHGSHSRSLRTFNLCWS